MYLTGNSICRDTCSESKANMYLSARVDLLEVQILTLFGATIDLERLFHTSTSSVQGGVRRTSIQIATKKWCFC